MKLAIGPVMTGRAAAFRGDDKSAIGKVPVEGPVAIGLLGLEGDEQADLLAHGGADKAIHHYALDHYAAWAQALGEHALLTAPGAFGENISTTGLTEKDLCIGDRLRLGTALVEVSHGRQPCWKIDHKFQCKGITAQVLKTGRAGWYYRVIEPGVVKAGDTIELVDRQHDAWNLLRVFFLLFPGKGSDQQELRDLAALPQLADAWKTKAQKLIDR